MAYATVADMLTYVSESELIELTDDTNTAVDEVLLSSLLDDSSAEIVCHLPAGSTVTNTGMIRRVTCLLTLYHLYARRGGVPSNDMRVEQFKDAQFFLTKLAQGVVRP